MNSSVETIKSAPLKNARELASMLKQLPRDERLRLEGVVIGIGMRCVDTQAQNSA